MAVVQISRIQIRRGKAQEGTGLPQLASGELAWAIDTQELWIGNGSVSEGAPAVGNTKVITAKDLSAGPDLLKLIAYEYRADENITVQQGVPIVRSIQSRLDDRAVAANFGVVGDYNISDHSGSTTDGINLQFAINQLYLNDSGKSSDVNASQTRVVLFINPGTYYLKEPLYVPSYTTIVGSGPDKTILYYKPTTTTIMAATQNGNTQIASSELVDQKFVGSNVQGPGIPNSTTIVSITYPTPDTSLITLSNAATIYSEGLEVSINLTPSGAAIKFVNDSSVAGTPGSFNDTTYSTEPRSIQISDLTVHTPTGMNACLQLDAVRDSLFENLQLIGSVDGLFATETINELSRGIEMHAKNSSSIGQAQTTTENNIFRNIKFSGFNYAVYAKEDVINNIFENCVITEANQGVVLGIDSDGTTQGQQDGPRQTQIINTKFSKIYSHGVYCERGTQNSVVGCTFINVGAGGGGNLNATTLFPQIYFYSYGNISSNNNSDRPGDLEQDNFDQPYIPLLGGHGILSSASANAKYLGSSSGPVIRLPMPTNAQGVPTGSISYTIDYTFKNDNLDAPFSRAGTVVIAADASTAQIQVSDEFNYAGVDTEFATALGMDLNATFLDNAGATYVPNAVPPYGILLSYTNTGATLQGQFVYSYRAVV